MTRRRELDSRAMLQAIEDLLAKFYTPSEADTWWSAPSERWGGKSAFDMVEDGRGEEVLRSLRQMGEGAYL